MIASQVSLVTGGAKVIHAGPCFYYGYHMHVAPNTGGCTLVATDSSLSATTGKDVLCWAYLSSGASKVLNHLSEHLAVPAKCVSGLRAQVLDFAAASGATIMVYWG